MKEEKINSTLSSCIFNETAQTYTFTKYYYNCINHKLNEREDLKKKFWKLESNWNYLRQYIEELISETLTNEYLEDEMWKYGEVRQALKKVLNRMDSDIK